MPSKKKFAKKYEMTRAAIADALNDLASSLSDIDTMTSSPSDVSDLITEVQDELEELANHVGDEAL